MSKVAIALAIGGLVCAGSAAVPAQAAWGFGFGFGCCYPGYYPPVFYGSPIVVYPAPAPAYYYGFPYGGPVYYAPAIVPARYYYGRPYYYRHYSRRYETRHGRYIP
jgi:hypothetical protein